MKRISLGLVVSTFALVLAVGVAPAGAQAAPAGVHAKAGGNGNGNGKHAGPPLLNDNKGKILPSATLYPIWWGPTADFPSDAQGALPLLLQGFNGSSYLGIMQQYMRGAAVSTSVGAAATDLSQPPTHSPSTSTIANEVAKEYPSLDPNGVYLVFTSNFPKTSSFCAWHAAATIGGVTIQFAYVPNANVSFCDPGNSLNANTYSSGTRSMADSTAHEVMEAITDPVPVTGWVDKNGQEVADKCEGNYQTPVVLKNGSSWQIQSLFSNAIDACRQS
jgi:hypothetical protein